MALTAVTFEVITPEYSWGRYGDFEVIIQTATGYINATRLCQLALSRNGEPKRFVMWKQNKGTQALIDEYAALLGVEPSSLITEEYGRTPDVIRGTYVHRKLIPHIAAWASHKFAIKMASIVEAYLVCKAVAERERQLLGVHGSELQRAIECIDAMARSIHTQDVLTCRPRVGCAADTRAGYVYVLMTSEYPWNHEVKIGRSVNPESRMRALQTGNAAELRIYKQLYSRDCITLEASLHERCQAYRVRGEWFKLTLTQIHEFTCDIADERPVATEAYVCSEHAAGSA